MTESNSMTDEELEEKRELDEIQKIVEKAIDENREFFDALAD